MEFKVVTIRTLNLNAPINVVNDLKAQSDFIADAKGYIDLSDIEIGSQCKVLGINYEQNRMYLNIYKRIA